MDLVKARPLEWAEALLSVWTGHGPAQRSEGFPHMCLRSREGLSWQVTEILIGYVKALMSKAVRDLIYGFHMHSTIYHLKRG